MLPPVRKHRSCGPPGRADPNSSRISYSCERRIRSTYVSDSSLVRNYGNLRPEIAIWIQNVVLEYCLLNLVYLMNPGSERDTQTRYKCTKFSIEVLNVKLAVSPYYFSRHYQISVKIEPLYLTYNTCYQTSNTTRVVQ